MSSVKENMMGNAPRQLKNAKAARKLCCAIGSPSLENMKMILKQNIIEDCTGTTKDVETAKRVVGPDVGTLKGKTARKKSPVVKNDLIEMPPEILEQHQDLVLEIDLMFVNGMPMLTSIATMIKFRSLVPLKDQTAKELCKALDVVLRKCNKNKFKVNKINCNQQFKPLVEDVEDSLGIRMNHAPMDEHVPAAERNNRTISEQIRVTCHKAVPKTTNAAAFGNDICLAAESLPCQRRSVKSLQPPCDHGWRALELQEASCVPIWVIRMCRAH